MAEPTGTPEFPCSFAEAMPVSLRQAVLRWWPSTRAGSRVKEWGWLSLNTASPDDKIFGDEHDVFPPNFSDWFQVLERFCASEDVARAAAQFEAAHSPDQDLWRELLLTTIRLPEEYKHLDRRTNKAKAEEVIEPLCDHLEKAAEIIKKDLRPAPPEFTNNPGAMRLPDQEKDGGRKLRAKHIDSPSVPNELRHEHERRKLSSEYRLYDFGVLRDLWTDPFRLHLLRAASAREVDDDAAEPVSLSACVSVETFEEIARALTSRLRAELQELGKPDLMQLSKGKAWHRYAVMRLERVFSRFYAPQGLRALARSEPDDRRSHQCRGAGGHSQTSESQVRERDPRQAV
jgi:hypothetical protein